MMWLEAAWAGADVREGRRPGVHGGGTGSQSVHSSGETPVMGVERRERRKENA